MSHRLSVGALALLLLSTSVAHATVVVQLSLSDQARRADYIVRARVGDHHSAYVPDRGAILTWTTLRVTESIKGQAPATLTLRQMGGTADGQTMLVPGDAHLNAGDDVILFLRRNGDDVVLVSLGQSAYIVHGTSAHRELEELTFAVWDQGQMKLVEPPADRSVALDTLLRELRSLVAGAR
jgi:hypothetical protein